ncbi:MAG: ribosome biogenesis GTPase Der [Deltaproteobacteria bacterium]|jgi:GTP-binding protein|nr:ribosome biogenesis GTPase Der [Deltaproteobacteria bacterium]
MKLPIISIIGRPNVGKSALFNLIIRHRKSLVEDFPGVTRDRIYGEGKWEDYPFIIIDTGGLDSFSPEEMKKSIASHVKIALEESDAVIAVVDLNEGIMPDDREIMKLVRNSKKPSVLAVNKVDNPRKELEATEFYELGVDKYVCTSAAHNSGIHETLATIFNQLPPEFKNDQNNRGNLQDNIRISFLGKPNAGKSSLVNTILNDNRVLVDDIAGTTMDAIEIPFKYGKNDFVLIDTAGMRRKRSIKRDLEKLAVFRAVKALESSDIVILVIDANLGIHDQDAKLASLIKRKGKGLIVLFNKWDLVTSKEAQDKLAEDYEYKLRFATWCYRINTSAKTGRGIRKIFPTAAKIDRERKKRISTSNLNKFLEDTIANHHPPYVGKRPLKFYYITQPQTSPPVFIIHVNRPEKIPKDYKRYVINEIRKAFGFRGTPIKVFYRSSHETENQ